MKGWGNRRARTRYQTGNLGQAEHGHLTGNATEGGKRQGRLPVSAVLGLPAVGMDSGKGDVPSQTQFRTFLSLPRLQPLTCGWWMDRVLSPRIWRQYRFIPDALDLKYKRNLLVMYYVIYLFQIMPKTYLKFFGHWTFRIPGLYLSLSSMVTMLASIEYIYLPAQCKHGIDKYTLNKQKKMDEWI